MWKLGRILDIEVSLHWSLFLLIGWMGLTAPAGGAFGAVAFISAIFGCVLLHELGHSLAARQFGIDTSSIVLLPIGGIATLERMPRKPSQELWIAVAGPLVNVVIAIAIVLSMGFIRAVAPSLVGPFNDLLIANIFLVVFNLLPAFPMDGGRILRAVLAMRFPYLRATQMAAGVGRVVAVALGCIGLIVGHLMLMLVAGFVFFAGAAEARMVAFEERRSVKTDWRDGFVRTFQNARSFTAHQAGEALQVIWDEDELRYRYVLAT